MVVTRLDVATVTVVAGATVALTILPGVVDGVAVKAILPPLRIRAGAVLRNTITARAVTLIAVLQRFGKKINAQALEKRRRVSVALSFFV